MLSVFRIVKKWKMLFVYDSNDSLSGCKLSIQLEFEILVFVDNSRRRATIRIRDRWEAARKQIKEKRGETVEQLEWNWRSEKKTPTRMLSRLRLRVEHASQMWRGLTCFLLIKNVALSRSSNSKKQQRLEARRIHDTKSRGHRHKSRYERWSSSSETCKKVRSDVCYRIISIRCNIFFICSALQPNVVSFRLSTNKHSSQQHTILSPTFQLLHSGANHCEIFSCTSDNAVISCRTDGKSTLVRAQFYE